MTFKLVRNLLAGLALGLSLAAAATSRPGASSDDDVLTAYDAYRAGDPIKFARMAKKLDDHLLEPWIDYWRIAMRLEDTPLEDVQAFFEEHGNTYVAEMLRGDWLKVLGKRGDWKEFARQLPLYPREDDEIRCYATLMSMERGEEFSMKEADWFWLAPIELPEGCARLAGRLLDDEQITVTDVWRRVRVLFARGQITAAKTALGYLAKEDSPDERMLAEAARLP
jgi:soluble lytic murein transglycosylase